METSAGSPRSSSGYGSSEEDHIRSSISAPQTPNSLSPLSSATIDLHTTFDYEDAIMPDFSDFGALSDSTSKFYCLADDWSAVNTPSYSSNDESSLALIDEHLTRASNLPTTIVDDFFDGSNNNILVSLLKQKSQFDSNTSNNRTVAADSQSSPSSTPAVRSTDSAPTQPTSPLQRLRALTHSNVVNNTELPVVVRPRIVINSPSNSLKLVGNSPDATPTNAVLRVGVVEKVAAGRAASERITLEVRSPFVSGASSSGRTDATTATSKGPSERKQDALIVNHSSSTAKTSMSPPSVINRRHRSELEDHRYSSLHPMPTTTSSSTSSSTLSRRASGGSSNGGVSKRPMNRTATSRSGVVVGRKTTGSSSILEALLLTNRTLRPNEGSEATLAACGVWPSRSRSDGGSASCAADDYLATSGPQAKRSCGEGSLLEHLLTSRTDEKKSTSGSETVVIKCEPMDDEDLFSGNLLYDESPSDMHLGGLFGQDSSSVWTPAFFDDRVESSELEEILHQEVRQEDAWLQHYLSDLL